jgi:lipid-A-disaccharide synthase
LLFPLTTLSVMGLIHVAGHLRQFFRLLGMARRYLATHQVDAVVLIDFPGFNWWVARIARRRGIPVYYYGVPQMWAWAPWRARKMKRLVTHAWCKLPFEQEWFRRRGIAATWVGHPWFDELVRYQPDRAFIEDYDNPDARLLVLLPGSRTQEVRNNLPWMLASARRVREAQGGTGVAIACFNEAHAAMAREMCRRRGLAFDVMAGRTPELISLATACIACSGSVSLELMYHRKPAVILYRVGFLARLIAPRLLRVPYITLVNLLAMPSIEGESGRRLRLRSPSREPVPMPEFLACRDCSADVAALVIDWLADEEVLKSRVGELDRLAQRYAIPGASRRTARLLMRELSERNGNRAADASGDVGVDLPRARRRAA